MTGRGDVQDGDSAIPVRSAVASGNGGAQALGLVDARPTLVRANSFGRRMVLATVVPLGLMACIAALLAWNARAQNQSIASTNRSANLVSDTRALASQFRDLDQSLRDYLGSGSRDSLAQFQKNEPVIQQALATLAQNLDPSVSPSQRDQIAEASEKYRLWSDNAHAVLARRAAGQDTSSAKIALHSLSLVDGVRRQLAGFISAEDSQRVRRSNDANRATKRVLFVTLGLALLSGLVLALFTVRQLVGLSRNYRGAWEVLSREVAERARAEQELRTVVNEARCILWRAEISVEGDWRDQLRQGGNPFFWRIDITDEAGAARVLPLDVPTDGRYIDALGDSRDHDDLRQMNRTSALAMLNGDSSYSQEFRCTDRDGRVHWMHEDVSLQPAGEGRWRAIGVVTDVTGRHDADQERRDLLFREQRARADAEIANRRKDQFLAVLSHELRTPLTPVLARVMLLKRDPSLSPELHQALDMIRRNVELEARLIDDLLDSTRLASGKIKLNTQVIDAAHRLIEVADGFAEQLAGKQLQLKVDLAAASTTVRADPNRLQQIFWNLISNAVKYTHAGGTITLHSHHAGFPNSPSGSVVFEISDTGVGIDEQTLSRLFKPFEQGEQTLTRRFGGLGLGLSISRSLLEMQGGTLTAASAGSGKGATFTLILPLASPQRAIVPAQPAPRRQTILLVEDNEDTLRVLARLLRHSGYTVKTAATVSAALSMIDGDIDLVISDIGLPDGNGWELMRTLKTRWTVPGIALSGFAQQEDVERSRAVGFARHLSKPINPQELEAAIEQVTAERAA
jgi:signal transduction histidine kinase/CheY-like chemotaxis protein/CHASE3 domain sensor protein